MCLPGSKTVLALGLVEHVGLKVFTSRRLPHQVFLSSIWKTHGDNLSRSSSGCSGHRQSLYRQFGYSVSVHLRESSNGRRPGRVTRTTCAKCTTTTALVVMCERYGMINAKKQQLRSTLSPGLNKIHRLKNESSSVDECVYVPSKYPCKVIPQHRSFETVSSQFRFGRFELVDVTVPQHFGAIHESENDDFARARTCVQKTACTSNAHNLYTYVGG